MTKKECFIEFVKELMREANFEDWEKETTLKHWSDALDYWNGLNAGSDDSKPQFTANGKLVLGFMQENKDTYNNLFKAKDIGEGLSISSRTASGAMRKLVSDGYVEKVGESPIIYSLTEKGVEANVSAE